MCQVVEENGNKPQKEETQSQNQPQSSCMPSSATGSTQGPNPAGLPRYHVETFPIPAPLSEYDLDHRLTMTIESQQRLWPQDIWVHSPHGRQLYQPVLMFETMVPEAEEKTETNGNASKSG